MIDWTEKPKICSKFAICAVQYNKFCCKLLVVFFVLTSVLFWIVHETTFYVFYTVRSSSSGNEDKKLNTGNNILQLYVKEWLRFRVQSIFLSYILNIYSNLCEADSLGENSGVGLLNTGCLLYIGFGRDHHMRSQKFSFTLSKRNKFGTLAIDLLKAEFLFLFFL